MRVRPLEGVGQGSNPLIAAVGLAESVVGQALAVSKAPLNSCAAPAARRRCSRTPRTLAPARAWRSRPTRRSSAWHGPSATTRRPSWPLDPRRRGEDARAPPARDPQAHRGRGARRRQGRASYDVTATGAADTVREATKPRQERRPQDHRRNQAHRPRQVATRASPAPSGSATVPWRPTATLRSPATRRSPRRRSPAS